MDEPAAPEKPPLWIEYIPLDELRPDPRNPKAHADGVLDESLERFGFRESVSIDERTGLLSAGHGRRSMLIRARRADPADAPAGVVIAADGTWIVPVQRGAASTDDDEALAWLFASNNTGPVGGWDVDAELAGLEALAATEAGFIGTGFTDAELKALRPTDGFIGGTPDDPDVDVGDQYGVTILCASAAEQQQVYERLTGEGFDVRVVTV